MGILYKIQRINANIDCLMQEEFIYFYIPNIFRILTTTGYINESLNIYIIKIALKQVIKIIFFIKKIR